MSPVQRGRDGGSEVKPPGHVWDLFHVVWLLCLGRRVGDVEQVGDTRRLVLQAACNLPFHPAWLCWPRVWPWPWQDPLQAASLGSPNCEVLLRVEVPHHPAPGQAQGRCGCCPGWGAMGGGLASLLHPPQLGSGFPESRDSRSGLPEQAPSVRRRGHPGCCQEGREGLGDERAFVSLCLCRDGTSSHPPRGGRERPVPVGGPQAAFGGGVALGPPFRHFPPSCLQAPSSTKPGLLSCG